MTSRHIRRRRQGDRHQNGIVDGRNGAEHPFAFIRQGRAAAIAAAEIRIRVGFGLLVVGGSQSFDCSSNPVAFNVGQLLGRHKRIHATLLQRVTQLEDKLPLLSCDSL